MTSHVNGNSNDALAFDVKRILVPTDFSAGAEAALGVAVELAVVYGASIRLLHVLTIYEPELSGVMEDTREAVALREHLEDHTRQQLAAAVRTHARRLVRIEPMMHRSLELAPAILEEADAFGADLIVLGTHGRRGVRHLLLGSVAEEIVRRAPVPVLTAREDAGQPIRRMLVPIDFSGHAAQALEAARALARRFEASLDLLHVLDAVPLQATDTLDAGGYGEALVNRREEARRAMAQLAEEGSPPASAHVAQGSAAEVIPIFAEAHRSDLIVMATHGLTGLARLLIGSVAERVVRTAPCPVLTIRTRPQPARASRPGRKAWAEDPAP